MECYSARPSRSRASGEVVSETLLTARRSFRLGGTNMNHSSLACASDLSPDWALFSLSINTIYYTRTSDRSPYVRFRPVSTCVAVAVWRNRDRLSFSLSDAPETCLVVSRGTARTDVVLPTWSTGSSRGRNRSRARGRWALAGSHADGADTPRQGRQESLAALLASPPFRAAQPEAAPRGEQRLAHDFAGCA